jgi:integrase
MGRNRAPIPKLGTHNGRARVWWQGRWYYLGKAGSEEARSRYSQMIAQIAIDPTAGAMIRGDYLMVELMADYLATIPSENEQLHSRVRRTAELLAEHHATTPVAEFGPRAAEAWRLWLCAADGDGPKLGQRTTKYYFQQVVEALRWAIRTERLRPEDTRLDALRELQPITRKQARAPKKVLPVDDDLVEKTLPHLRAPVAAMVRMQRLTGMRPKEVRLLRPCDVRRSGVVTLSSGVVIDLAKFDGLWVYVPPQHKTGHLGHARDIAIGPKAQEVLRSFLDREPTAYCFSARESMNERQEEFRQARIAKGGGSGGSRKKKVVGGRVYRDHYTRRTYHQAIEQACVRAGLPHWFPYQLRHSAGTESMKIGGLVGSRGMLGHSDPRTTLIYAERDFELAAEMARKMG